MIILCLRLIDAVTQYLLAANSRCEKLTQNSFFCNGGAPIVLLSATNGRQKRNTAAPETFLGTSLLAIGRRAPNTLAERRYWLSPIRVVYMLLIPCIPKNPRHYCKSELWCKNHKDARSARFKTIPQNNGGNHHGT
jgi:hypothetical protein